MIAEKEEVNNNDDIHSEDEQIGSNIADNLNHSMTKGMFF